MSDFLLFTRESNRTIRARTLVKSQINNNCSQMTHSIYLVIIFILSLLSFTLKFISDFAILSKFSAELTEDYKYYELY